MIRHLSRCVGLVFLCLLATGRSVETTPRRQLAAQPPSNPATDPATVHAASTARPPVAVSRAGLLNRLPLAFERNEGQVDPSVRFLSRGGGYTLFLASDETVLSLSRSHREPSAERDALADIRLRLVGANTNPRVVGEQELSGRVNYFIGRDPAKWRTGVRTYARVREENVYLGVDVVYYGTEQGFEFDFVVAPGADPSVIALDVAGADTRMENGSIIFATAAGDVRLNKPIIYQEERGVRREIAGGYIVADGRVRFEVAQYDRTEPLVIDPYVYFTYVGGSATDKISGIAVDGSGYSYVTGTTGSMTFPTPDHLYVNNLQANNSTRAFVGKFDNTGTHLLWLTYVGSGSTDEAYAIAIDSKGRAYATGRTYGPGDFPIKTGALQKSGSDGPSAFMFRLKADGSDLEYSTTIGGGSFKPTEAWGIAVWQDPKSGDVSAFVAGDSTNDACVPPMDLNDPFPKDCLPIQTGIQDANKGGADAFVMQINTAKAGAASLVYSTFLGSTNGDSAEAVAVDSDGGAYVTGLTKGADFFPVTLVKDENKFQPSSGGGWDAFVVAVKKNGAGLAYASYLGGSGTENDGLEDGGIAVDANKYAYVTGTTGSSDLLKAADLPKAVQNQYGGSGDAFVAKIGPSGTKEWITYLGGSSADRGYAIAVDPVDGNPYVTGMTLGNVQTLDFPEVTPLNVPCYETQGGNGEHFFMVRLTSSGQLLAVSIVGGNGGTDTGNAIAVDGAQQAYVAGYTNSSNLPTTLGAFQTQKPTLDTGLEGFVAVIPTAQCGIDLSVQKKADHEPVVAGEKVVYTITVTNNNPQLAAHDVTVTDTLSVPSSVTVNSATTNNNINCPENPPGIVTCALGTLVPKEQVIITLDVTVNDGNQLVKKQLYDLHNHVEIAYSDQLVNASPDDDHFDTHTNLYKTLADLGVTKSAPKEIFAGEELLYTITVTNNGPSAANGVTVVDTLPNGVVFDKNNAKNSPECAPLGMTQVQCVLNGALSAMNGQNTWTVTIVGLPFVDVDAVSVTNTVEVGSDDSINTSSATAPTLIKPSADLKITKQGPPGSVDAGVEFSYILTVQDNGPSTATGVLVTDTVPSNTEYTGFVKTSSIICSAAPPINCWPDNPKHSLTPKDGPQTVTIKMKAGDTLSVTNTAHVESTDNEHDPDATNNTSTAITPINAVVDLSISKKSDKDNTFVNSYKDNVNVLDQVTYTITVKNAGPSTATSVIVSDPGPVGMTFVSWSQPQCTLNQFPVPYGLTCELGPIKPNGGENSVTITLTVIPFIGGQQVNNTAAITDGFSNSKYATASVKVAPAAWLEVTKSTTAAPTKVGQDFAYFLNVINHGPSTAKNISVQDQLPEDFKVTSNGSCFIDANNVQTCASDACVVDNSNFASCAIAALPVDMKLAQFIIGGTFQKDGAHPNTAFLFAETFDYVHPDNSTKNKTNFAHVNTQVDSADPVSGKYQGGASQKKGSGSSAAVQFTLPATLVAEATDSTGAAIDYSVSAPDGSAATCSPASGSTFPVGRTTTVTCSATDVTGNTTSSSFTVDVRDTRPSTMIVPGAPLSQHEWTFGPDPVPLAPGAIDLAAPIAWDSGFTTSPAVGILHTGVARSTRSVCSATYPLAGRAGVLLFNGSSESLVDFGTGAGQFGTNDFALSLWVRGPDPVPLAPAGEMVLLSNRSARGGSFFELRLTSAGAAAFEVNDGGSAAIISQGASSLLDGAWHHIVAQRHGADSSVYVDGVLAGSASGPDPTPINVANGNPLLLGGAASGGTFAIDPFRIFTRALTGDEIQRSFAAGGGDGTCGATEAVVTLAATGPDGAPIVFGPDPTPFGPDPSPFGPDPVPFLPFALDVVDANPMVACQMGGLPIDFSQPFPVGATRVTCMATDASGNTGSASFIISVVDATKPSITAPANVTAEATGPDGATVDPGQATASDDVGPVTITRTPIGNQFPLGTTTITWTATDGAGNFNIATQQVTVVDTTKPAITAPANVTAEATGPNGATVDPGQAAASDIVGPVTITRTPTGNQFPLGSSQIVWTATDGAGNFSTATQQVTVVDTTKPAVTTSGDVAVEATSPSGAVVLFVASATDLVDGLLTPACGPASGSMFPIGTTSVTCSATDAHSNTGSATLKVTVLSPSQITSNLITEIAADNFQQASNLLANVMRSMNAGNIGAACNQWGSFISQVRAQSGKSLTTTEAQALIGSATDAKAALGCR